MTEIAFRSASAGRALPRRFASASKRLVPGWRLWLGKRRSRRRLADLDDRMLRDIGVSRAEAMREIRKSFPWC